MLLIVGYFVHVLWPLAKTKYPWRTDVYIATSETFTKLVECIEHQAGKMKSKNKFIPLVDQMSGLLSSIQKRVIVSFVHTHTSYDSLYTSIFKLLSSSEPDNL